MSAPAPWQDLGAHLHEARHRAALTQHHVARQLGITQAAYSQIERGLIRPRPALLLPLAILLGIGLGQLAALAGYPLDQLTFAERSKPGVPVRRRVT
jgi:transcriptional regulator with XRE-family HTH domain